MAFSVCEESGMLAFGGQQQAQSARDTGRGPLNGTPNIYQFRTLSATVVELDAHLDY